MTEINGIYYRIIEIDKDLDIESEIDFDFPYQENFFVPTIVKNKMSEWNFSINLN
jgi:hypothetical protein